VNSHEYVSDVDVPRSEQRLSILSFVPVATALFAGDRAIGHLHNNAATVASYGHTVVRADASPVTIVCFDRIGLNRKDDHINLLAFHAGAR